MIEFPADYPRGPNGGPLFLGEELCGEITFIYWIQGVWTRDETGEAETPTHWMPLPDPPSEAPTP